MEPSRFSRSRQRPAMHIERLEDRALLAASVASTTPLQIQPMGIHPAAVHSTAPSTHTQGQTQGANAGDALNVGKQYSKVLFSHTSGTVISDYAKAILRGNVNQMKRLGSSNAVQQLGSSFDSVAHSSQARSIGHSFDRFGHSVSHEFYKIFG